jgi:uncharacterized protein
MATTSVCALLFLAVSVPSFAYAANPARYGQEQIALGDDTTNYQEACPDYTQYSAYSQ